MTAYRRGMTPRDFLVTMSLHAREAIEHRGLDISLILNVAANPEQARHEAVVTERLARARGVFAKLANRVD